jgi:putative ABC transport system permease protein
MASFRVIWDKLRGLVARERGDRGFDDELEYHLSLLADRFMRQGMTAEDAGAAAKRQFGNSLRVKEDRGEIRTFASIETVWQDLRFGARALRRSPGFAVAAIATLALGLGVNAAIFSVVKTVLLDRMPYSEPDRLVMISEDASNACENSELDYTTACAWKSRARSFDGISAYGHINTILLNGDKGEMVVGLAVTHDFFDTLGVKMQLGRTFNAGDDRPGPRRAVILTNGLWSRRFGSDPQVIGEVLRSEEGPLTVIGVLPPGFEPLIKGTTELDPEMYLPLNYDNAAKCQTCQPTRVVGRMKHGIKAEQARMELDGILRDLTRAYPEAHRPHAHAGLIPVRVRVFGRFGTALWVVTGAAAFVLLIACANLANLLLVKATARARETALRAALGASRQRLVRQFLTESLLLACAGGAAGLLLALAGTRALASFAPPQIPRAQHAHLDSAGLLFGFALTVATGILFGMVPALRASRSQLSQAGRGAGGTSRGRMRNTLVIAELALAFVLASGAGLMVKTFLHLMRVDPGYEASHVLTLTTALWGERY